MPVSFSTLSASSIPGRGVGAYDVFFFKYALDTPRRTRCQLPLQLHQLHHERNLCIPLIQSYSLASKIVALSLLNPSSISSSDNRLNEALTYALFLPSGKNTVPGNANTPFSNALFRTKFKESPSSPGLSAINSLNHTNMPASGVSHSASPSKLVLRARSNASRFCL